VKNINLDLSSNLIDIDKSLTSEEYVERLVSLLEPILKQTFPHDHVKRIIKIHRDRISISCPYCMDSMQSSYKKRGNLILTGKHAGFYKCFNCSKFTSIDQFFKDYNINLKLDVINYISENLGDFSTASMSKYDISLLLDIDSIEGYAIVRSELKNTFDLIEAKESPIWSWLVNRMQYQAERFLYSPSKNYLLILNLTPSGKIIGSQKRLFSGYPKYLTFGASKLYEIMGKGEVPDEIDTISQLFGILQLDFNKPIFLLEGPFDSFLIKNSIANLGANKKFPIDLPLKYIYDKDETGIQKSINCVNNGNEVFLWEKFLRDIKAPHRKKWDINDVFIWAKSKNIKIPYILDYFSNDPLDIVDL